MPINQIVVHNQNLDVLETRNKNDFIQCLPYELPCQSLFFALLTYKAISEDSIGQIHLPQKIAYDLKNFELVHLSNIRNLGEGDIEDDIEPWCDTLTDFGNRAKFSGGF